MAMVFGITGPTGSANTRSTIIRANECAVRTSERLSFDYSEVCFEGWARLNPWFLSGGVAASMALACINNAEIVIQSNGAGGIRALTTFRMQDTDGTELTFALSTFAVTAGATWQHFAFQFNMAANSGAAWLGGVLQNSRTDVISPTNRIFVKRAYIGLLANTSGADFYADPAPAAAGSIALDNWRLSNIARHTLANFSVPTAAYVADADTVFIWPMRETVLPYLIQATTGNEWGTPRLSAFNDRRAGPWTLTPAGVAVPVT